MTTARAGGEPTGAERPNVVVIITDDQGPWAMGCAGNPEIRTPNLDRLAASGIRFRHFFCASPVCSPARASLLTGCIPSTHGVHDWLKDGNGGTQKPVEYLAGITAYTDVLAAHGYRCGLSGKWHLGDSPRPQKGFTHWYAHQFGGGPYNDAPMIRDGQLIREPGYVTERITDDALTYLDRHAAGRPTEAASATGGIEVARGGRESAGAAGAAGQNPFYLHVCYTAPHSPWIDNHPQELVDSYADCAFESCPQEERHPWAGSLSSNLGNRAALQGYFAAVTAMDANVGRILDRLEQHGLRESTLVLFTSDNGFSCGHHGFWGKGNGTFPMNMYENSVTVPTLISRPGHVPSGVVCDALLSHYDVFPTLLDYLGLDVPDARSLPGRSFAPLLRGAGDAGEAGEQDAGPAAGREYIVAGTDSTDSAAQQALTGRHMHDEYGPVRMVRTRDWKYVHRYPYGPHELFDLKHDPGERRNLVDDAGHQATRRALKAELDGWFVRYADPARDGVREPVTGKGQLDLAGPAGNGAVAFAE
ncbi:MAG TPA: sulfatase-like hydrolase/transferase [Chloroflexota bacterium]|nr:sulfatase-like hydrolase/transferase [Chloroflexota bacterium]